MDKYYGNVCELDIIFSFTKAYYILDEILLAGELQESSKKNVLRCINQQDSLEDMEVSDPSGFLLFLLLQLLLWPANNPYEHPTHFFGDPQTTDMQFLLFRSRTR